MTNLIESFTIQEYQIESSQRFLNPGWFGPTEDTFVSFVDAELNQTPYGEQKHELEFVIEFRAGNEIVVYSRSIYNALDFLGDVGGLFDALKLIGAGLIGILGTGDGLAGRLIGRLFYTAARTKDDEDSTRPD